MKNKVIISFIIFIIILLGVVFANSYAQALSKEERLEIKRERLEEKVRDNIISEQEADEIYKMVNERMESCDNECIQNENCQVYQKHNNCIYQNNQCSQRNYNCRTNCNRQQNCGQRMCNR